jgi:hypothetical protein
LVTKLKQGDKKPDTPNLESRETKGETLSANLQEGFSKNEVMKQLTGKVAVTPNLEEAPNKGETAEVIAEKSATADLQEAISR